jgi:hypothetical protein
MRNVPQHSDLLPGVEILQGKSDDAKENGSQSKHVTTKVDLLHKQLALNQSTAPRIYSAA